MTRLLAALLATLLSLLPAATQAQDRVTLGWGRLFANDALGDGEDRWRTGAYTVSHVRGTAWSGDLPAFGDILELRAQAAILAPDNIVTGAPWDRRYAGVLSLGLFTHFQTGGVETSLGAGLQLTGRQTRLGWFQTRVHDLLGAPIPGVLADQIPDRAYLMAAAEVARTYGLGDAARLRPFLAAETGVETLVRAGADVSVGSWDLGALMLRDTTTGQRYRAIPGDIAAGLSFTLGGDIAHVFDSALLPAGGSATLDPTRTRLRAGISWQGEGGASVFYGLTWLSKEFTTQPEAQLLGALNLSLNF